MSKANLLSCYHKLSSSQSTPSSIDPPLTPSTSDASIAPDFTLVEPPVIMDDDRAEGQVEHAEPTNREDQTTTATDPSAKEQGQTAETIDQPKPEHKHGKKHKKGSSKKCKKSKKSDQRQETSSDASDASESSSTSSEEDSSADEEGTRKHKPRRRHGHKSHGKGKGRRSKRQETTSESSSEDSKDTSSDSDSSSDENDTRRRRRKGKRRSRKDEGDDEEDLEEEEDVEEVPDPNSLANNQIMQQLANLRMSNAARGGAGRIPGQPLDWRTLQTQRRAVAALANNKRHSKDKANKKKKKRPGKRAGTLDFKRVDQLWDSM